MNSNIQLESSDIKKPFAVKKQFDKDFFESKNVLICTHAYPPDSGGIAAFARDIYVVLENAGSSVSVFKTDKKDSNKSGRIYNYTSMLKSIWELFLTIRKEQPDIVICSRLLSSGVLAAIASIFFKFKLITQVHGTELRGRHGSGWRKWFLQKVYNSCDQIWANSQFTSNLLQEYGCDPSLIKIIYPFITKDALTIAESIGDKESKDTLTILTAATLYPRKGIDLVLKALAKLTELDWKYRIAGKPIAPAHPGFYEEMAADLRISDKVKFLGQLEREQLWTEMANSDIFVMPSRGYEDDIESFGIVFIEAGLFGVPSIGTDVGGIKESIGDGGIIIEDENINELTESLRCLIGNKVEREKLSKKAIRHVRNGFTEESRRMDIQEAIDALGLNNDNVLKTRVNVT
jgi:phosphatidylinositol alpha-1,6-mannosyltransferase